ncbi:MAG: Gfo/Idh/MocA family oxidoreductase, partial [Anaerolineae bacterium]|nr:Gfo/Idh/MocA family oxidoreductase [Anaerolineae bacterium]
PIAANLDAARRIAGAAERAGLVLTVGHIERFNPAIQELKRRLDAGQGGPVLQVRARRVGPFPHRIRDVGVIHDLGPHDIDIMRYLLGDEIERVYAESRSHIATGNEDMFAGLVRFRGGAMGTLDINWLTPTKVRELTLTGERGMFQVNYLSQELTFYENQSAAGGWDTLSVLMGVSEGNATRLSVERREPLMVELDAFVHAVREGGAPPVPPRDALASLALATAILRAGHTGEVVRPGLALESGANHRAEG